MAHIPPNVIEDVLRRTDLLQVVQQYLTVKRSGTTHKGLCPFHEERTPSFHIYADKGFYKCYGCGASGDVISLLRELEGWTFPEAVRHLAGRVGVEIPEDDSEEAEAAKKRHQAQAIYVKVMTVARDFFVEELRGEGGAKARAYLQERGIDAATAEAFHLGYAPDAWDALLRHLNGHNIPGAWAERAGLVNTRNNERGGYYDRFRDRVVFPVVDIWNKTLAFGARRLGDDGPKYINSPETRYYTKGKILFGLHAAREGIRKEGFALLVEGNFDVVALHAAGLNMTVAPMGTAFTLDQAKLLKRYAATVYIAFDGDDAGQEATYKCLGPMEQAGVEAHVITLPPGEDPDSIVRRDGPEALRAMLADAPALAQWCLNRQLARVGFDHSAPVEQRIQALQAAAEVVALVRDPIAWKFYAEDIARRLDIEPHLYKRFLKRPEVDLDQVVSQSESINHNARLERQEELLLILLLERPEWIDGFLTEGYDHLLSCQELAEFLQLCAQFYRESGRLDAALLMQRIDNPAWRRVVSDAFARVGALVEADRMEQFYREGVRELMKTWAARSLHAIDTRLETLNLSTQREAWTSLYAQKKEIEAFRGALSYR